MNDPTMSPEEFSARREVLNNRLLEEANLSIRRFFALDHDVYADGALPQRTKELLGLVASTVLRCDDCIRYHLSEAIEQGVTKQEIIETFGIALVVGGSITIPHLREAIAFLDSLGD